MTRSRRAFLARTAGLAAAAWAGGAGAAMAPNDKFDLVVADVPCSGSGSWRRDPDGRWRLTPERLDVLLIQQAAILDDAAARDEFVGGLPNGSWRRLLRKALPRVARALTALG